VTTPFAPGFVGFQGQDPGDPQYWDVRAHRFWLGKPGNMIELPSPQVDGYTANGAAGEVEHGLSGGGSAVTRFDSMMRRWNIAFLHLAGRDYQVVNAFYRRLLGFGPWCFLPPEETNRLALAQSMCGGLHGVAEGWTPTTGTIAYNSAATPYAVPSGVLRYTGGTSGAAVRAGYNSGTGVDLDHAAPYIPAEPYTASSYAAVPTGAAAARMQLLGIAADGVTIVTTLNGPTVTLATAPALLSVTALPGDLIGSAYVVLSMQNQSVSSSTIDMSCAQLEMRDEPTDWAVGTGVPRVIWPTGRDRALNAHMASDITMTLAETITGAA
jgi:hypothetical protein